MKKLWTIAILFNVVFAQLPQPTIVGQDDLQIPTLSINNFVNEAEVVGLELFPGGDVRDNIRPSSLPMLWNDAEQPLVSWCRQNDWWLQRGTQRLRIFNSATQQFEAVVNQGGIEYPMVESVVGGAANAPVIIK